MRIVNRRALLGEAGVLAWIGMAKSFNLLAPGKGSMPAEAPRQSTLRDGHPIANSILTGDEFRGFINKYKSALP